MRARVLCVMLLATLTVPVTVRVVHAQATEADAGGDDVARRHFRLGRAHYANGEFAQAATEFEQAYHLSNRPALLYNVYVAYRDAQDLPHAASSLSEYLRLVPNAPDHDQTPGTPGRHAAGPGVQRIDVGHRNGPVGNDGHPSSDHDNPVVGDHGHDVGYVHRHRPAGHRGHDDRRGDHPRGHRGHDLDFGRNDGYRYVVRVERERDDELGRRGGGFPVVPVVVGGAGAALLIGSLVTGLVASGAQSDLQSMCPTKHGCSPSLKSTEDRGRTFALVSDVLLAGGIVGIGVGALLLVLRKGSSREQAPDNVSLSCGFDGCQGSYRVRF